MKKIDIKDMQLIVNKTNAANVTSTMMNLLRLYLTLSSYSFVFGITLLFVAANTKEKKTGCLTAAIICLTLFAAIVIFMVITNIKNKLTPNLIFIGKKMYIKASKQHYIELLADELDNYKFVSLIYNNKLLTQRRITDTSDRCTISSLWGKVILECKWTIYYLICSDLRKARHYIDGFKLGIEAEENQYVSDNLKIHNKKLIYMIIPFTVGLAMVIAGCIVDSVWWLSIIGGVIGFATLVSMIVYSAKHHKEYLNAQIETYQKVICTPPINCNKKSDNDDTQSYQDTDDEDSNADNKFDDSFDTTKNDFF